MRSIIGCAAMAVLFASPAWAERLPKTATPMSSAEIEKLYSGKSTLWKISSAYFAPDKSVKGIFGKPKVEFTFKGRWEVSGNEICTFLVVSKNGKEVSDCWKYWKDGKATYTLWSRHFDGSKVDDVNGYYTDEVRKLKDGDLVSKEYAPAGGT